MSKLIALTFFVMFYYFVYIGINQVSGNNELAFMATTFIALITKVEGK